MTYDQASSRSVQKDVGRSLNRESRWFYSNVMVVGAGPNHHAGCYLAAVVPLVLKSYQGGAEFAKLNGGSYEFKSARNGLLIVGEEVQPGDRIVFRFEHGGKKMRRAVSHLTNLVCRDSD